MINARTEVQFMMSTPGCSQGAKQTLRLCIFKEPQTQYAFLHSARECGIMAVIYKGSKIQGHLKRNAAHAEQF